MHGGPQDPSRADTHPGSLGDPHSAAPTPTFCAPRLGPEAACDLQGSQRGLLRSEPGPPVCVPHPQATPLGWALPTAGSTQEESRTHSLTRERRVAKASGWMHRMAFQLRSLWERGRDERRHTHGGPVILALGCGAAGRPWGAHRVQACREHPTQSNHREAGPLLTEVAGRRAPYSQRSRGGGSPTHRDRRKASSWKVSALTSQMRLCWRPLGQQEAC